MSTWSGALTSVRTGHVSNAPSMMTLAELKEDLVGLSFELGREIERDVVEGKYHDGKAAVVQVIARRPA